MFLSQKSSKTSSAKFLLKKWNLPHRASYPESPLAFSRMCFRVRGFLCVLENFRKTVRKSLTLQNEPCALLKIHEEREQKGSQPFGNENGEGITLLRILLKITFYFPPFILPLRNNLNEHLGRKYKSVVVSDMSVQWRNAKQSSSVRQELHCCCSNIPGLIVAVDLYYPPYLFPWGAITIVSLILSLNKGN